MNSSHLELPPIMVGFMVKSLHSPLSLLVVDNLSRKTITGVQMCVHTKKTLPFFPLYMKTYHRMVNTIGRTSYGMN